MPEPSVTDLQQLAAQAATKARDAATAAGDAARWARYALRRQPFRRSAAGCRWLGKVIDWSGRAADAASSAAVQLGKGRARQAKAFAAAAREAAQTACQWQALLTEKPVAGMTRDARAWVGNIRVAADLAARRAANVVALADRILSPPPAPPPPVPEPVPPPAPPDDPDPAPDPDPPEPDADESVTFAINRSGDLSGPCSVSWAIRGDVTVADFAAGTDMAGEVAWDDGDGGDRLVELVLAGGAGKTLVLALSDPDGAVLGNDSASLIIGARP